jgi:hypothetical protein
MTLTVEGRKLEGRSYFHCAEKYPSSSSVSLGFGTIRLAEHGRIILAPALNKPPV